MYNINKKHILKSAFSLMEAILYIAIASVVISTIVGFIALLTDSRLKSRGILTVEQESIIFMDIIEEEIRSSDEVILPAVGTETQVLELSSGKRIYLENENIFLHLSDVCQDSKDDLSMESILFHSYSNHKGLLYYSHIF